MIARVFPRRTSFRPTLLDVEPRISRRFIAQHHYAVVSPLSVTVHVGICFSGELKGVIQLGYGTRPRHTIQALFPQLGTKDYFEICRFCLLPELPHNSESHVLALVASYVKAHYPDKKLLFTWADGLRGKPGYIYQASNYWYGGYIVSEFYTTPAGEVIHPRLLITRYGTRSASSTAKAGLTKYFGMQFRYIKFLCSRGEEKRLLAASSLVWNHNYPKLHDLMFWRQAGQGSRESCQLPILEGSGQFRSPAPLFDLKQTEI